MKSEKQSFIFPFKIENKIINDNSRINAPKVFWLTGLSGSGKTSLGIELRKILDKKNIPSVFLDGDNLRDTINSDLGFSDNDRKENIRRTGELTKILYDLGLTVIVATISPFVSSREKVRGIFEVGHFFEIFLDCDIKECKRRDPKNLYKLSSVGLIKEFTGYDSKYEKPKNSELIIDTNFNSISQSKEILSSFANHVFVDINVPELH